MPHVIIWLKKQAKVILGNWLRDLSVQYHLPFQKLSIRAQKTVWGSCTACKNIQLNYKILFLPAQLARYILIHELCHTVHMNHSRAFWALVACYVPQYRECIKQLKQADHHMPRWISL
jgi:predicted metal-dependent hydrolase